MIIYNIYIYIKTVPSLLLDRTVVQSYNAAWDNMSLDLVTKPGIQLMFLLVEMCKSRNTHTHT